MVGHSLIHLIGLGTGELSIHPCIKISLNIQETFWTARDPLRQLLLVAFTSIFSHN